MNRQRYEANQFIEITASELSLSQRKPVFGVGTNDADYLTNPTINGKQTKCSIYRTWQSMLMRCYSDKFQAKHPTYTGCSVCDEWLTFSSFRRWMIAQNWQGKQLDKDIRVNGNKVYSPETCCFVTHADNMIEAKAKHYVFISPLGETVDVYNLRQFCRDNELHQGLMCAVHLGKANHHKRWTSENKGPTNE